MTPDRSRRFSVPEVIQTSAMDCGPAALASLLRGFSLPASYGRLREACQTAVDGTSIDELERVGCALGLDLEQVMLPLDHLLEPSSEAVPSLIVVRLPSRLTHFVVVWRRLGRLVQVMDPAVGRRWMTVDRLLAETYVHRLSVGAADWREYAGGEAFTGAVASRLARMLVAPEPLLARALADPGWRGLAALDAAVRLAGTLVASRTVRRGDEAARLVYELFEAGCDPDRALAALPSRYWCAFADEKAPQGTIAIRGAVLLRAKGRAPQPLEAAPLPPELEAVRRERPRSALVAVAELSRDSVPAIAALGLALVVAAAATAVELLAFRGLVDAWTLLRIPIERIGATAAVVALLGLLLAAEWGIARSIRRVGLRLEAGFRLRLLRKLPRIGDRYFQSRLVSDMASRAHALPIVRAFPVMASQVLRSGAEMVVTAIGIAWLDPPSAPIAFAAALAAVVVPLAAQRRLADQDLRLRTHGGALARFYLDALLGLIPVRAHAAERSVRREHDALLSDWARTGRDVESTVAAVAAVQGLVGAAATAALVFGYFARHGTGAPGALLLVYWALLLPALGLQVAVALQQFPAQRSTTLRLLEVLYAPEEESDGDLAADSPAAPEGGEPTGPVAVALRNVRVVVGGHEVLRDVSLDVPAGAHLALVGGSGAGKSTLLGLLLGWFRPATGEIVVDGRPLAPADLPALRERIAWVDPAVQIWNRSLLENLRYGAPDEGGTPLDTVLDTAELRSVLERLPEGMQTPLGEGGGRVSGGEGQRVRLARALARRDANLVLLDEPFRGLDRSHRRELLRRARSLWSGATLICVTHDIEHALEFEAVAVMEGGRIVETGAPAALAREPGSRLAALLEAERRLRDDLWLGGFWKRLRMDEGRVVSEPEEAA